jgi:osmoprotectant transport system permease protein
VGAPEEFLMSVFADMAKWFADGKHWSGPNGVPIRVLEHVEISATGVALALLVALPVGLLIGHVRRGEFVAVSIANLGRAIPSFAILSIVFQIMLTYFGRAAFGFWPTVIALLLLAIPPILTNTYVGIEGVDRDTVEAARGMGMTGGQVLARLEFPLALPLMIAGIRTAAVQVVATATLAALIAGGGLGRYIIDGFAQGDTPQVLAGAVLVAVLAILTELGFGLLERMVSPRTSSQGRKRFPTPALSEALPPGDAGLAAGA